MKSEVFVLAIPGWSPFAIVEDRQSHSIFSVVAPLSEGNFHFLVRWDEDRDPRILGCVLALYYRRPDLFENVVSWFEHKATLTVQVVGRVVRLPTGSGQQMVSSTAIEVRKALELIIANCSYAIVHDYWDLNVEQVAWPPGPNDRHAELHRLFKLGPQRAASVPSDIVPAEAAGVTVTYATDGWEAKNGGRPGRVSQDQYATLDAATAAPLPDGATAAMIQVIGGTLVRQHGRPWTFQKS
jgi:hypothetical protein